MIRVIICIFFIISFLDAKTKRLALPCKHEDIAALSQPNCKKLNKAQIVKKAIKSKLRTTVIQVNPNKGLKKLRVQLKSRERDDGTNVKAK